MACQESLAIVVGPDLHRRGRRADAGRGRAGAGARGRGSRGGRHRPDPCRAARDRGGGLRPLRARGDRARGGRLREHRARLREGARAVPAARRAPSTCTRRSTGRPARRRRSAAAQGRVYLYTEGEPTPSRPAARPAPTAAPTPSGTRSCSSPATSTRSRPDTLHWFQAGRRRRDRLRVLDREPRRARRLHRPRDRPRDRRRRWLARGRARRSSAPASSSRTCSCRRSPRLPEPGELVATDDFVVETGGCAANAAIALARLGVRRRGRGEGGRRPLRRLRRARPERGRGRRRAASAARPASAPRRR